MIFMSYSNRDRAQVEPLVIDLGLLGHNVYFEEKSPERWHDWDEIFSNIERSDAFIYTITQNTQTSYSRLLEYEHALALGKPIIPIRLEEIDLWLLPPGLPAIIDYHPDNAAEHAELVRILNALPPVPPDRASIARPEIAFALAQLLQRINTPEKSPAENAAILLNLQEFLERRETFPAAEAMLDDFSAQIGSADPLAAAVEQTRTQIQRSHGQKTLLSPGWALKGLFGLAMAAALFWVVRSAPMSKILGDPMAVTQNADPPLAATPTLFPTNTVANVSAYLLPTTGSPTATPLSSSTPSVASSPTIGRTSQYLSFMRVTHPPALATSQPPSATYSPPQATHVPPTATPPPPATQQPPTARPQRPTSTTQPPSATPQPPPATPQPPKPPQPPATPQPPPTKPQPPTAVPPSPSATPQPPGQPQPPPATPQPPGHPPPPAGPPTQAHNHGNGPGNGDHGNRPGDNRPGNGAPGGQHGGPGHP
ncbi:MAG TPA: toll/interleukin-1 receptor domain-containing protein [Phototrophicaceae bacterium]|nr:toll/interleukin-1 receptor domain-containing protein [Phototrophicaceae bacterium]